MFGNMDVFGQEPALPDGSSAMGEVDGSQGRSPDGIGAYSRPSEGGPVTYHDGAMPMQTQMMPMQGAGATLDWYESQDATPEAAIRSAGITALLATVALGVGVAAGGAWGAGSGVLLAGAAVNGYRAQKWWGSTDPSEKHEAVVSAVFAAFGIAVGGYMGYKAYESRKGD
jgi:hypothetical protein